MNGLGLCIYIGPFLASQTPYGKHFLWSFSNDGSLPLLIIKIQNGICMNNTDYNNGRAR